MSAVEHSEKHEAENHAAHAEAHKHPGEGTYFTVFIILAALTIAELTVVYAPGVRVPLLLGLAASKAWLVVQFYMHLRYESRLLNWIFLIPMIAGITITILIQPLVQ